MTRAINIMTHLLENIEGFNDSNSYVNDSSAQTRDPDGLFRDDSDPFDSSMLEDSFSGRERDTDYIITHRLINTSFAKSD